MRNLTVLIVLIGALAAGGPALARDITLKKTSADELKAICGTVGGKFSQDPNHYGCGTDCHGGPGTDCIVSCAPDGKCVAQAIGARRPRSIQDSLQMPERKRR
jgi:hypothetical protein